MKSFVYAWLENLRKPKKDKSKIGKYVRTKEIRRKLHDANIGKIRGTYKKRLR